MNEEIENSIICEECGEEIPQGEEVWVTVQFWRNSFDWGVEPFHEEHAPREFDPWAEEE